MPRKGRQERFWLERIKGSPHWYIHWYDERSRRTRRRSTGLEDHREAEVALAEFILRNDRKRDSEPEEVRLATVMADYLEWIVSHPSGEQACIAAGHLERFFGSAFVSEITLMRQEEYIANRRKAGIADATISREFSVLRAALRRAHKLGILRSAPHIIDLPKAEPRDRWLRAEEAERLVRACKTPHVRLFVILALHTGARPSSILQLEWFQVDLENRVIDFNPPGRRQGAKRRPSIKMSETLYILLKQARDKARTSYVIEYHGRPVSHIRKTVVRAAESAGLSGVTPYTLRHTAATWMAQAGVPMWEIAGMLGHTTTRITERVYAKHSPDFMHRAVAALDSVFGERALRASYAQSPDVPDLRIPAKLLKNMVGAAGIEPATPTMST